LLRQLPPFATQFIVPFDFFRMLLAVARQVARVLGEPALGVGVAALETGRVALFPVALVRSIAGCLTLWLRAGDLSRLQAWVR
jgi:hypothetical protein